MSNDRQPDGRSLNYVETGKGPPLILIHGSPGEARAWNRVLPFLAGDFHVLAPDVPGYGTSDGIDAPASQRTAALAAAIGTLAANLGGKAVIAAHSYGGNVAMHMLAADPDSFAGAVLFEPVFFRALELAEMRGPLDSAATFFKDYAERAEVDGNAVADMIGFWFGPGAFARLPAPVQEFLRSAAPKNAADVRAAFSETLALSAIAKIRIPVVIAYGAASPPVARSIAEATAGLLSSAKAVPIAGANHGMIDTHAAEVAGMIRDLARMP